ncbi:microtubule-associated protein futsch isoform X1 [Paralichthys olivaceus]|uniref:microtubule-associated protein futsch isoform X1 n=2 Tax=Paralichthys olivaceus TaxID=8255 RepID=UPI00375122E0
MEASSGDIEEGTEEIPGRKKSKLKSLKTRLFGRSKKTGGEGNGKLSQSFSDITAEEGLGSEEDLVCSQGMMGSRALSHDSIFLAEGVLTDTEPARVLSQENVHSKIKALQMKLQQQKMHLGPPPLVVPVRRPEDLCSRSEDEGSSDVSGRDVASQGGVCKTIPQPPPRPLSPISKPALIKFAHQFLSHPLPPTVPSTPPIIDSPLDFSSPAQFIPCLDTSAARHRMSVKPRNQRASTKKRLTTQTDSRLLSHALNNIDHPQSVGEEEQQLCASDKVSLQTEQGEADTPTTAQHLPSKSPEVAPITSEEAPKSSSLTSSQPDQAPPGRIPSISPQVLRPKPQRPVDVMSVERPHSSFIESELKNKREGDSEIQVMSHDKRNTLKKTGMTEETSDQISSSSAVASRPSSIQQQVKDEIESMRGIKRSAPGSGSFHFSITTAKNQDRERPRSGSFVGVLIQAEARHKSKGGTEEKRFAGSREKEELKDRVGPFAVGHLKQEGALPKGSGITWDKRDTLKKTEPVASASKNAAADTGTSAKEEVESSQEEVEEAMEAQEEVQEEEGKTAFGVKLRSTSQSMRVRADASLNHSSKLPGGEDQCDKQNRQEMRDNVGYVSKKPLLSCTPSTSGDTRVSDPTPSGSSLPLKNTSPSTGDSSVREVGTSPSVPQEPQPAPAPASSEVSWMSLAMEKTRTLQQLFTSRFPRDFTGAQAVARPQAQMQPTTQTETQIGAQTQTQTVKMQQGSTPSQAANQPSSDTVKTAMVQSTSQAQAAKPSLVSVQQNTASTGLSNTPKEAQTSKQTNESQSHPSKTQFASQCLSHPPVQTKSWTTQSPLRSSTQADTSPQLALQGRATQCLAQSSSSQQATSQSPTWTNRGVHPTNQLKPTALVSTTSSTTAPPPPESALRKVERDTSGQEKEGPSPVGRRAVWGGSVSERAAFLEKQVEWITPAGAKEVELKKAQTEAQSSDESPVSANTTSPSTYTKPEGRPGVKLKESSPTNIPDRPCEDKWLRKTPASSLPSSSPTQSSELQSISDSGQPSWMELAKRKSMAWSDKTMD